MMGRIRPRNLRQQVIAESKKRDMVFFAIITLALFYLGAVLIFGNPGLIKYNALDKTKKKLEAEVKHIERENEILKAQINALKEDTFYIEKHAREEFGLAKSDEYIFQFQNDKN
jgi:cell division protein FtsB